MRTEAPIPQSLLNKQLSRRGALGLGVAAAVTVACGGGTEVGKRPSSDNQLVTPDNRTPNPNLTAVTAFPTAKDSTSTPFPSSTNPESDKESTAFPTAQETATSLANEYDQALADMPFTAEVNNYFSTGILQLEWHKVEEQWPNFFQPVTREVAKELSQRSTDQHAILFPIDPRGNDELKVTSASFVYDIDNKLSWHVSLINYVHKDSLISAVKTGETIVTDEYGGDQKVITTTNSGWEYSLHVNGESNLHPSPGAKNMIVAGQSLGTAVDSINFPLDQNTITSGYIFVDIYQSGDNYSKTPDYPDVHFLTYNGRVAFIPDDAALEIPTLTTATPTEAPTPEATPEEGWLRYESEVIPYKIDYPEEFVVSELDYQKYDGQVGYGVGDSFDKNESGGFTTSIQIAIEDWHDLNIDEFKDKTVGFIGKEVRYAINSSDTSTNTPIFTEKYEDVSGFETWKIEATIPEGENNSQEYRVVQIIFKTPYYTREGDLWIVSLRAKSEQFDQYYQQFQKMLDSLIPGNDNN